MVERRMDQRWMEDRRRGRRGGEGVEGIEGRWRKSGEMVKRLGRVNVKVKGGLGSRKRRLEER